MPNTTKVIYAWNKNILNILKNPFFSKQEIYKKKYHIIDIHVNTEVLTTGLVIPSTSSGIDPSNLYPNVTYVSKPAMYAPIAALEHEENIKFLDAEVAELYSLLGSEGDITYPNSAEHPLE